MALLWAGATAPPGTACPPWRGCWAWVARRGDRSTPCPPRPPRLLLLGIAALIWGLRRKAHALFCVRQGVRSRRRLGVAGAGEQSPACAHSPEQPACHWRGSARAIEAGLGAGAMAFNDPAIIRSLYMPRCALQRLHNHMDLYSPYVLNQVGGGARQTGHSAAWASMQTGHLPRPPQPRAGRGPAHHIRHDAGVSAGARQRRAARRSQAPAEACQDVGASRDAGGGEGD
jgi:hypothetical protein